MKASIAHGIRPSALVLGRDSRKTWSRTDIVLAKAYQRFLNELCQQCGYPKYICHTDDNRVQFRLVEDHCASAAKAEKAQHEASNKKDAKPRFGVKVAGEPYLTEDAVAEGMEFSDFRRPYLIDRARKLGLIPEEGAAEV